jgi:hypothetical protein
MLLQLLKTAIWNVLPSLLIRFGAPVIVCKLKLERAIKFRKLPQDLDTSIDNLRTDTIGSHGRYGVCALRYGWRHDDEFV